MYNYLNGTITEINFNTITLDVSGVGYQIYVSNPYSYIIGKKEKIYIYQHIKEDENTLYGFKSKEDKELYLKLISVKGVGPKMALPMFASGTTSGISDAIERGNILYLKKFPKVGDKVAKQIILDLKGKLNIKEENTLFDNSYEELIEVLKGLGYKEKEIKKILPNLSSDITIEQQIKEALRLLLK